MLDKTIKVARYRTTPYISNFTTSNGGIKSYIWAGSTKNKVDIKDIPMEFVDWLTLNSRCFQEGELVIVEDTPEAKEIIENSIEDIEELKNNSHSKEEMIKILEDKNITRMKKTLEKITVQEEKRFVIEVAKEIKLDSKQKIDYLANWLGVPVDILFDNE